MRCAHEYYRPTKQELTASQAAIARKIRELVEAEEEAAETHRCKET
jgi:hypothetical protein